MQTTVWLREAEQLALLYTSALSSGRYEAFLSKAAISFGCFCFPWLNLYIDSFYQSGAAASHQSSNFRKNSTRPGAAEQFCRVLEQARVMRSSGTVQDPAGYGQNTGPSTPQQPNTAPGP